MEVGDSRIRSSNQHVKSSKQLEESDIINMKKYQNIKRQALFKAYSLHRKRRQNRMGYAFMLAFATLILMLILVWK